MKNRKTTETPIRTPKEIYLEMKKFLRLVNNVSKYGIK
jgi:hypothetical protein